MHENKKVLNSCSEISVETGPLSHLAFTHRTPGWSVDPSVIWFVTSAHVFNVIFYSVANAARQPVSHHLFPGYFNWHPLSFSQVQISMLCFLLGFLLKLVHVCGFSSHEPCRNMLLPPNTTRAAALSEICWTNGSGLAVLVFCMLSSCWQHHSYSTCLLGVSFLNHLNRVCGYTTSNRTLQDNAHMRAHTPIKSLPVATSWTDVEWPTNGSIFPLFNNTVF